MLADLTTPELAAFATLFALAIASLVLITIGGILLADLVVRQEDEIA